MAWQGHDAQPLVALFVPGAEIVGGRGAEPDALDVRHTLSDWAQLLAWQLAGRRPNIDDTAVDHEDVVLEQHGDTVRLEVTRTIKTIIVRERVRERFELVLVDGDWRAARLRWWPIEARFDRTTVDLGPEGLRKLDAAIDEVPATDLRKKAQACSEALRFTEAAAWYDKLVATADAPGLLGKTFGEALQLYPTSCLVGLARPNEPPVLNPPMDSTFERGTRAVVVAEDDDPAVTGYPATVDEDAIGLRDPAVRTPERTAVFGWTPE